MLWLASLRTSLLTLLLWCCFSKVSLSTRRSQILSPLLTSVWTWTHQTSYIRQRENTWERHTYIHNPTLSAQLAFRELPFIYIYIYGVPGGAVLFVLVHLALDAVSESLALRSHKLLFLLFSIIRIFIAWEKREYISERKEQFKSVSRGIYKGIGACGSNLGRWAAALDFGLVPVNN